MMGYRFSWAEHRFYEKDNHKEIIKELIDSKSDDIYISRNIKC